MRLVFTRCLFIACLGALGIASAACATPTIDSIKGEAVPIPGFPKTGDALGAGAALKGSVKISGTEYGGSPAPLIGLVFDFPAGTKLHPQGFSTCTASTLELRGPQGCAKDSSAGSDGWAVGTVTFGGERVPERATLEPFFAPGGQLELYVSGHTPALVEVIGKGHIGPPIQPYGPQMIGEIPLIMTVPEGLDASFQEGAIEFGAARREAGRTVSYLTLPKHCPRGGWPAKLAMTFLGGGEAASTLKVACPHA
jgi:hypothetical protein